jgi:hypothetical protein
MVMHGPGSGRRSGVAPPTRGVIVFTRTSRLVTRVALASGVMLGTVVLSLGVSVPNSSAASGSAFCKTILSYETVYASKATPPTTMKSYGKWAKSILPFYEKLASESPNGATKTVLNEVVTILKYEGKESSIPALEKYVGANETKFAAGTKALEKAIVACVA